ncbi:DUF3151 domain-containing protein [Egibacter rhizosphaerae]|uniref:DUF3151 domain-containing protein n=1 Tax=Egibacter rhizosphaerae TaxID=1670831 RepID=A0A411YJE9_9ACTN|nr:DUF3151 domain-containing protein [Egibacter rhizosphaerae]QBI21206.1 DUF3151 domain-containing protein [Egibacter rhizosphaerae]
MSDLPMHGVNPTHLDPPPEEATVALERARTADDPRAALRRVVAVHPTFLAAWAELAENALEEGDPVAAYAFARTGHHRGLDALRKAGWKGQGPVPSDHEPNVGFVHSVDALRRAARQIGEEDERLRCEHFLVELDPGGRFDPRR